jgi:ribosomal protein S18 acetylase RimI-like enzyme/catechol 2,3-dioxygenase-like lactoylglutathione lyase family enzyme
VQPRPTREEDLDFVVALEGAAPHVTRWPREEHRATLDDPDFRHFILQRDDSSPVGYLILAELTNPARVVQLLRIVVDGSDRGRGHGRAGVRAAKQIAFEELGVARLWLDVREENERARALYASEGFVLTGRADDDPRYLLMSIDQPKGTAMKFHRGRLLDHVHLRVSDVAASQRFYRAVLATLDIKIEYEGTNGEGDGYFGVDELYVSYGPSSSHVHLAFQAPDRATVDRFYRAALEAGGRDNGAPGERPYHPGYYAGFILDPDGNNVEAVHHGPARRSAASIEITPDAPG